jgi:hypothetical protein
MSSDPQDRSTDKYYKSKSAGSVVPQSMGDSVRKSRKPGESPVATPNFNRDDTTTDKYYREGGSRVGNAGQPIPAAIKSKVAAASGRSPTRSTVVAAPNADIRAVVATAKEQVQQGLKVEIAVPHTSWIARANALLDSAVCREEITEDQRRDIVVWSKVPPPVPWEDRGSETRSLDEMLGAPTPRGTEPVAAVTDDDLDIDDFLAAGTEDAKVEEVEEPEDNELFAENPNLGKVPRQPKVA